MHIVKKILKFIFYVLIIIAFIYFLMIIFIRPNNNRNWSLDQKILPEITFTDKEIIIKNIRNLNYRSTTDYDLNYYDAIFERNSVKRVWFIVEPFSTPGAAHTFLSFEFEDGRFLSISIEIRKEVGEKFSALKGLLRQYELMYVIADEKDVIKLRANYRKDIVYLYPASTTKEKANKLFENMLLRAKTLQENPEFYNTLTNTCTTNIVRHINELTNKRIPFDKSILMPANADLYAYDLGLIDTNIPKNKIRERYKINELSEKYANDPNYSYKIRGY